jgi:hypothetical protein
MNAGKSVPDALRKCRTTFSGKVLGFLNGIRESFNRIFEKMRG